MLILLSPPKTEAEENDLWLGNESSRLSQTGRQLVDQFDRHDLWIIPKRLFVPPAEHMQELARILYPLVVTEVIEEFTARSMGSLTSRAYRDTMKEFPRRNWLAWQRSFWNAPPDGESLFDISDRILTAFRSKVLPIPAEENVLIICSSDVMRILIGFITKTEEAEIPKINIESFVPYVINGIIE